MRLWHIDLLPYLPRKQIIGQWRECILIAKNLAEKGTPNFPIVNRILDYGSEDFLIYGEKVVKEIRNRGYRITEKSEQKFYHYNQLWRERRKNDSGGKKPKFVSSGPIFQYWHNKRYLEQCYHNLEEKYDSGAVTPEEFETFTIGYKRAQNSSDNVRIFGYNF